MYDLKRPVTAIFHQNLTCLVKGKIYFRKIVLELTKPNSLRLLKVFECIIDYIESFPFQLECQYQVVSLNRFVCKRVRDIVPATV